MRWKITVWLFQATNKQNPTWEALDMAKKEKPWERNWISSDNSTKQCHRDNVKAKIDKMKKK